MATENSNQCEKAVLAGGCFWGMQELIRKLDGVVSTRVGYAGGQVPNATYRNHGTHAEAIEVLFDPAKLSYRNLLKFFFRIHDPTTVNAQGNDRGTSYRSAIFYCSEEQRMVAEQTIADVERSGKWPGKVVTQVASAGPFWEAEPEHQDYLQRYPDGYTCHFVRPDWTLDWSTVIERSDGGAPPPPRRVEKSDEEWRNILSDEQFRVARAKGTERPHSSSMCSLFSPGRYACVCCGTELFDAGQKFDSGTGWPSFTIPVADNVVGYHSDVSHGMRRVEVTCAVCDAHLGHVFPDGPGPTGLRYCINGVSLTKVG